MKIAMMSAWNQDSGASTHAELIGRQWVKMGLGLKVFSFYRHNFHGTAILAEDEPYVVRCFTTSEPEYPYLDPRPILEEDFDIFLVNDPGTLPKDSLAKIFHNIRKKAATVVVIHESEPSADPSFYQFEWDRVICFDDRYRAFLGKYYPEARIRTIPFPAMPLRRGDMASARRKLGLPANRRIILIFGQRLKEHRPVLAAIHRLQSQLRQQPLLLLVVSRKDLEILDGFDEHRIEIRKESPSIDRLYDYLHASDVLVIHRSPNKGVVISSTALLCLGSGCPILASDTRYFETMKEVVLTYRDDQEFEENLLEILNKGERFQAVRKALYGFLEVHSAEHVAKHYVEMFSELLDETLESPLGSSASQASGS